MEIWFKCQHCDQHLLVDEQEAGKMVNCPSCNRDASVPTSYMVNACGGCGALFGSSADTQGETAKCSQCGDDIYIRWRPLTPARDIAREERKASRDQKRNLVLLKERSREREIKELSQARVALIAATWGFLVIGCGTLIASLDRWPLSLIFLTISAFAASWVYRIVRTIATMILVAVGVTLLVTNATIWGLVTLSVACLAGLSIFFFPILGPGGTWLSREVRIAGEKDQPKERSGKANDRKPRQESNFISVAIIIVVLLKVVTHYGIWPFNGDDREKPGATSTVDNYRNPSSSPVSDVGRQDQVVKPPTLSDEPKTSDGDAELAIYYQRIAGVIKILTDIKAGYSVGINRNEYNRLLRELASETMRVQSDLEFLRMSGDKLPEALEVATSMCGLIDSTWDIANNCEKNGNCLMPVDGSDFVKSMLQLYPSAKGAIKRGVVYGSVEGWVLDIRSALTLMMGDASEAIATVTGVYDRRMRYLDK